MLAEEVRAIRYEWRGEITDGEMVALVCSHGGNTAAGWWNRVRPHSLGWVVARTEDNQIAGFVNVAWDGADHAFLLDTKVRGDLQRQGIGTALVTTATGRAREAGCEWLHVDFEPHLRSFYFDSCGFDPTEAGLIRLRPRLEP